MNSISSALTGIVVVLLIVGAQYWVYSSNSMQPTSPQEDFSVRSEEVNYFKNAVGLYAEPEGGGMYPGVVMIHEWWGLNQNIKDTAIELAKEGYRVLAVDLFGKVATSAEEARVQVVALNQGEALENLKAAVNYLRVKGSPKVASLGWCFGGRQSVELAVSGEKLDATVVYYGSGMATTTERLAPIKWPVLGIFGDKDQAIPIEMVRAFESSLDTLGVKHEIHIYPGVGHAFANPSNPNYAPEETKDAWAKTLEFLKMYLK